MAKIKDVSVIAAKWARRSSTAGPEYEEGVRNPRRSWSSATAAAEEAYKRGVTAAITRGAFGKGVRKAGDAKWSEAAISKGPNRFAEGVSGAQPAYASGYAPYASVISSLTLPARGAKGDPANINRVAVLAKALHDTKISLEGK
jgi:hypothetical protein